MINDRKLEICQIILKCFQSENDLQSFIIDIVAGGFFSCLDILFLFSQSSIFRILKSNFFLIVVVLQSWKVGGEWIKMKQRKSEHTLTGALSNAHNGRSVPPGGLGTQSPGLSPLPPGSALTRRRSQEQELGTETRHLDLERCL